MIMEKASELTTKKGQRNFLLAELLTDLLNSIHHNPDGIVLSSREVLETYGISKSSYYRFIDFLKRLDFLEIIWINSSYRKVILKNSRFTKEQ